ncbi:caffeine resistance protein, putative [Talaromyces stipitatus ATCC 10500]|uniref:Caffeine resistance protein, putative n=1 Tax=Talaromyces stipitatus (strain ATCC 10500 / CBS 375.48 / QM 6759 / NRRL 1006) TaxID=441959 RepID=B8MPS6_TALSN|nr:caffeine resistance protein, putative [Talaromyces stipitatus ATCC 10500]EED12734.1 caffeine resistance protein, putative [Talaromyces stipitatus ATCC 10500]
MTTSLLLRETAFGRVLASISPGSLSSTISKPSSKIENGLSALQTTTPNGVESSSSTEKNTSDATQYLVDWSGPDDPSMPVNWPLATKLLVLTNVILVNLSFYTAPGIYTASIPSIEKKFGVSEEVGILGLALFVIAYGIGPLILSPISNVPSFGRTPVYVLGSLAFCLFCIGCALAKNIETILILRFFGGIVGTSPTCIGGTTLAEVFGPREVPYAMAMYVFSGLCGPVFGPLLGTSVILRWNTWAAALWLIAGMSALSTVFLFFFLPETLPANILLRRAKQLRETTGDSRYHSPSETKNKKGNVFVEMIEQIAVDFRLSFIDPIILFVNIHTMLIYGILYLWFEFFPYVFEDIYGFTQLEQCYAFFGILVGAMISVGSYMLWMRLYFQPHLQKKQDEGQTVDPEEHIIPGAIGAICIPICMFIFAWGSRKSVHWIVPVIGTAFFAPGFHLTFQTVLNYLGQSYPRHVAGVFAGNAFFRSSFGGALPLAATRMIQTLGIGWAASTLGFIAVAMIPPLFVLQRYGKRWRSFSSYAN